MQNRVLNLSALGAGIGLSTAAFLWGAHLQSREELAEKRLLIATRYLPMQTQAEQFFRLAWQTNRTIGQLPSFKGIVGNNRVGEAENVVAAGRISQEGVGTAQQLYNNLAANLSVSEVYCILKGFRPDKGEIPFLMYDALIVGDRQKQGESKAADSDFPEEFEDEEYNHYSALLHKWETDYATVHIASLDDVPAASSPTLRTCDNSQYLSKSKGNPAHAAGFAYSSPFWDNQGRFRGIVSSIFRTDVLAAMLMEIPFFPVTSKDSTEMTSQGWTLPANSGDFVLVNQAKGIVAGDPRDSAWLKDAARIDIKQSVEIGSGDWYAEKLKVTDDTPWILLYRYNREILRGIHARSMRDRFIWVAGVWLLIAAAWGWSRAVERKRKDLERLGKHIDLLAEGDLVFQEDSSQRHAKDETSLLLERFDRFKTDLALRMRNLLALSAKLNSMAQGLGEDASQLLSQGDAASHSSTNAAAAAKQGTSSIQGIASAAHQLSAGLENIGTVIEELQAVSNSVRDSCSRQEHDTTAASAEAKMVLALAENLTQATRTIGKVVNDISQIAGQTRLLSLNATIEAARAGEAGKGFAVVASHVRDLSSRTQQATEEASQTLSKVSDGVAQVHQAMEQLSFSFERSSVGVREILQGAECQSAALSEAANHLAQSRHAAQAVAKGCTESAQGFEAIAGSAHEAARLAANSAESVRGVEASTRELSKAAKILESTVSFFRT